MRKDAESYSLLYLTKETDTNMPPDTAEPRLPLLNRGVPGKRGLRLLLDIKATFRRVGRVAVSVIHVINIHGDWDVIQCGSVPFQVVHLSPGAAGTPPSAA